MAGKPLTTHANDDAVSELVTFVDLFSPGLGHERAERIEVAHLDRDGRLLRLFRSGPGETDSIALPMRRIVRDAIDLGAAAWVIAHNHPSGDTAPSRADVLMTRRFLDMAYAIDIVLLDHLIFAAGGWTSFRASGLI